MRSIAWLQVIVGFILGALFGQRFAHMHPVGAVRQSNGGA